jgi:NADH-quinone oxidoreductase subunit I
MAYDRHAYRRKEYWNQPTMGVWERLYLPEILRGIWITGGVFMRNMAKWMTGRKGALTSYYPEEMFRDWQRWRARADAARLWLENAREMCAIVWPGHVIEIDAAFDPGDPH